ncbi:MAG: FtsX-like permease family protein [Flavitalea sp.]
MFRNYLLTAIRTFRNNKAFSLINILGLAIGITSAMVIFMIVYFEFSWDNFEKDRERIYRVVIDAKFNGNEGHSTGLPAPLANAVRNELTGFDKVAPVMYFQGDSKVDVNIVSDSNNTTQNLIRKQDGIIFTTSDYLAIPAFKWLVGSPAVLNDPFSVVLTKSRAHQYFGKRELVTIPGARLTYSKDLTVKVAGIVDDLDENTAFNCREFISYSTIAETSLKEDFMMNVWNDWMAYSQLFIKLDKSNAVAKAEAALNGLIKKYDPQAKRDAANNLTLRLQPLDDIHFNAAYYGVGQRIAHKPTLYGLMAIGGFLLLLGCINFINLTTAQATKRSKEIGIRKTMGGVRRQLVIQFLGETFLLSLIALICGLLMIPGLLNTFESFIPPGLTIAFLNKPGTIIFILILLAVVTLFSGSYPAMVLSGFKPVLVLKNQVTGGSTRSTWLRKSLTVSQFLIAQIFVIATLMVGKQIRYSMDADIGFNKEAVINFRTPRDAKGTGAKKLIAGIRTLPGVQVASTGFFAPADMGVAFTNVTAVVDGKEITPEANIQLRWGTPEYLDVYQLKLAAGRVFAPSDTLREFLVNEAFTKTLGFKKPEAALNTYLKWNNRLVPIVGVLKDFHDQSMHASISPIIFGGQQGDIFHVRLKPKAASSDAWINTIASINKLYREVYPEADFDYIFMDDMIARFYERETNTAKLLSWATGLAILISCLGLAGLVIYTTNSRKKEIGIRKVLGASVSAIIGTLSKDFLSLVLIAFVLAVPITWWAVSAWLNNFSYRTEMSWWVFAAGGAGLLVLAFITIASQTLRAARQNPVESLRTE